MGFCQEKFTILLVPHIGFLCYSGLIAEKLNAVCRETD